MKSIAAVFDTLHQNTPLRRLRKHRLYRNYITLLKKPWQEAIAFVYVKNGTLFIALTHPGYRMELHYHNATLQTLWNRYASLHDDTLKVEKVILFVSKHRPESPESTPSVSTYREQARGSFEIKAKTPQIQARFRSIKHAIKQNRR